MGLFCRCFRVPLPQINKIFHTFPQPMKLGLQKKVLAGSFIGC